MPARLPDWRQRLSAAILARRAIPEIWGASDCALTAAALAAAMLEGAPDLAAPLRGYRTPLGAARKLKRQGFASVAAFLDSILPRTGNPREGDFALEPCPPLDRVGIYAGRGIVWTQAPHGLERVAAPPACLFWSV